MLLSDAASVWYCSCEHTPKLSEQKASESDLFRQSERNHYLSSDISDKIKIQKRLKELGAIESEDNIDPFVIYIDSVKDDIDCKGFTGIRNMRQCRVSNAAEDEYIYFRKCNASAQHVEYLNGTIVLI